MVEQNLHFLCLIIVPLKADLRIAEISQNQTPVDGRGGASVYFLSSTSLTYPSAKTYMLVSYSMQDQNI